MISKIIKKKINRYALFNINIKLTKMNTNDDYLYKTFRMLT